MSCSLLLLFYLVPFVIKELLSHAEIELKVELKQLKIINLLYYHIFFNRKFDIGIYAIITSIDPLRVYIVDDEALYRLVFNSSAKNLVMALMIAHLINLSFGNSISHGTINVGVISYYLTLIKILKFNLLL